MTGSTTHSSSGWTRLLGEFLIIVVGVLVALGVDDVRQRAEERELEAYLVDRVAQDLEQDIAELERTTLRAERRIWLANEILRGLGDPQTPDATDFPAGDADPITCASPCDPANPAFRPLRTLAMFTQFDITDGTYRELLSTGSLRVLSDLELRDALAAYYNSAAEGAGGDARFGQFHERFLDDLEELGLSTEDDVSLDELVRRFDSDPSSAVTLRRFRFSVRGQLTNYQRVHEQASELVRMLPTG